MKDSLIFDSHEYVKRMTEGGFNEQQAETLATEQADLLGNLATSQDIETVRQDIETLRQDIQTVRDDLENMATRDELEIVKNDLETVKQNMLTKDDLENMIVKYNLENMATKQDIEVSAQTLKVEMIKWMTGYFLSGLAVLVAVLKLA